jgi:FkbM family methyltransferase
VDRKRGLSKLSYAVSIPRLVWRHPANRHRRTRAVARAIAWQLYKRLVRKPKEIKIYSGMRIRCYPGSNSASNLFYFTPYYEYDEMLFLERYLRPGDGFIDGGANIGTYSLLAAGIVGFGGRVVAFEPTPEAARRFRENLALNDLDWVDLREAALAERSGVVPFRSDQDVSNRIVAEQSVGIGDIQVPSVSLDECLPSGAEYAMAKLDLEGAEVVALRGAERHLSDANPPVWQVEIWDHLLRDMGTSTRELLSLLFDHGYEIARYDGETNRLDFQLGSSGGATREGENLLGVSRSHRDEVLRRITTIPPARTGSSRRRRLE